MRRVEVFLIVFGSLAFAARPPFTPEDLWALHRSNDPRISAGGEWVIYEDVWNDRAANAELSNLYLVAASGKESRRLTSGSWRDWSPRWSPEGDRIAWISDRGGKARIRVVPVRGGSEGEVSSGDLAPLSLVWAPNGRSIAFTARVPSPAALPAWAPAAVLPLLRPLRTGSVHLFVAAVSGEAAHQISKGDFDDLGEPAWMPDGQSILCARDDGQIWSYRPAGGDPKRMTAEAARSWNPAPSPDGSRIAWLSVADQRQSYAVRKLNVMNADGSRARVLAGELDRDVVSPEWSSDSRTLYFLADDHGSTYVYAARNDGTARRVTNTPQRLRGFSLADDGRAVSVRSTSAAVEDVVTFAVDRVSATNVLAAPNEHLLAERELAAAEEIRYESAGNSIQGWLVKPPGADGSRKYPLLVDARDDPRSMYGPEFHLRAQIFAARGFAVLCVNARGSPGYGELFGHLLHTRFPGDDFDDLMKGVDFVAAKGWVDPERLYFAGGLLSAWAIGHTTRFRAVVARRPIVDWTADVGLSSEGMRHAQAWMRAFPWEDPDQYVKRSPIYFAQNFQTPTLVLAGSPDPQSEMLYFALTAKRVRSALVRFEKDDPASRVLELEAMLGWLN